MVAGIKQSVTGSKHSATGSKQSVTRSKQDALPAIGSINAENDCLSKPPSRFYAGNCQKDSGPF